MKRKDFDQYKQKSPNDLSKKLDELVKEKINLVIDLKMGKLKNVHQPNYIRRQIAKIKTIINIKKELPTTKETTNATN